MVYYQQDQKDPQSRLKDRTGIDSWQPGYFISAGAFFLIVPQFFLGMVFANDVDAWWDWYIIFMRISTFSFIKAGRVALSKRWMMYVTNCLLGVVAADVVDRVAVYFEVYNYLGREFELEVFDATYLTWICVVTLLVTYKHRINFSRIWQRVTKA